MSFYDPEKIQPVSKPGRNREMIVQGTDMLMMQIERFEADKGGSSHPNEQMTYLLEGKAKFRVGEEVYEVGPGQAVHVPSNVEHELELLTPTIRYIEVFSPPLDM